MMIPTSRDDGGNTMITADERDELDILTTTASHILTLRQMQWIRRESKRQGKSMSEVVRDAIDAAMATDAKRDAA